MNTLVSYEYRDGSNYHWHGSLVLSGEMSAGLWKRIRSACHDGEFFIAHQVGLSEVFGYTPGPHQDVEHRQTGYPYDEEDDHCWHRFPDDPRAWEVTNHMATDPRDVRGLGRIFEASKGRWQVFDPAERFGF